jgi:protein TonB
MSNLKRGTSCCAKPADRDWLWLAGVAILHGALLTGAMTGAGRASPLVTPPAIIGLLVVHQPPAKVTAVTQAPQPRTAGPSPSHPVLAAPPAEHAATTAAAPTTPAEVATETIIPPHTDAAQHDNPVPEYPPVSRRLGEQGRVLFDLYILPDGSVGEARLRRSSGHARLDGAALDAVRRWRYMPARRGLDPIPYWYVQPVTFSLDG